jgi:hypothetical protein
LISLNVFGKIAQFLKPEESVQINLTTQANNLFLYISSCYKKNIQTRITSTYDTFATALANTPRPGLKRRQLFYIFTGCCVAAFITYKLFLLSQSNTVNSSLSGIPGSIVNAMTSDTISRDTASPKTISEMTQVTATMTRVSDCIGGNTEFSPIRISAELFKQIPKSIQICRNITRLSINDLQLNSLPVWIGDLPLVELNANNNLFVKIPNVIRKIQTLQILSLGNNRLKDLPQWFGEMSQLARIDFSDNRIEAIQESLKNCTKLNYLFFNGNRLKEVPSWLGDLPNGVSVNLANNPLLTSYPESFLDAPYHITLPAQLTPDAWGRPWPIQPFR